MYDQRSRCRGYVRSELTVSGVMYDQRSRCRGYVRSESAVSGARGVGVMYDQSSRCRGYVRSELVASGLCMIRVRGVGVMFGDDEVSRIGLAFTNKGSKKKGTTNNF
ncbi:hypothetical protein chiPu_0029279 [Chiloscyllium punctatum]|uniref:Uncharacterized protein n=1 Tax=Chiloscyllium punctatum TaxID=137246 RepID=A0A401TRD3_CHIPU|nr:hypothetical protein [Chiloscyllium punctatum]